MTFFGKWDSRNSVCSLKRETSAKVKVLGHDDSGEPIWQLTREEYQQQKQQNAAARAKAKAPEQGNSAPQSQEPATEPESTPGAEGQSSHCTEAAVMGPQTMELASSIWEMRKRGLSRYEVHRRLGIPMEAVDEMLAQFERHFYPDVGRMLQHYATLDDARLEDLLKAWMPVATGGPVERARLDKRGTVYTELDSDLPLKASAIVLGAIKNRIQLLAACRPEGAGGKDGGGATNVLVWLQSVLPGIQKVVDQTDGASVPRGRRPLGIESEAEATDISRVIKTVP